MCRNDASSWCYSLLTRQLVVASHLSELGRGEGIRPVPILPALYAVPFATPVPLPRLASVAGMDVDLPRMGVSTGIGARDDLTHAIGHCSLLVRIRRHCLRRGHPRRSRGPPSESEALGSVVGQSSSSSSAHSQHTASPTLTSSR